MAISAQAAQRGSKGKKNSADLAARHESVVRELMERSSAQDRAGHGIDISAAL
ncbi:MAG: hypothetical protein ACRD7E_28735 [Bryobacteraceae bacterium]